MLTVLATPPNWGVSVRSDLRSRGYHESQPLRGGEHAVNSSGAGSRGTTMLDFGLRERVREAVTGVLIDVITWEDALRRIGLWASRRESRVVCLCNVHSVMTASQNQTHCTAIRSADIAAPDGAPVAWALRRAGHNEQVRVSGPELMLSVCELAERDGLSISLLGGTPETLERLQEHLLCRFPKLIIASAYSPPFRALTPAEDDEAVEALNAAGTSILFVGLGCPKQEAWMHAHRDRVRAVMLG